MVELLACFLFREAYSFLFDVDNLKSENAILRSQLKDMLKLAKYLERRTRGQDVKVAPIQGSEILTTQTSVDQQSQISLPEESSKTLSPEPKGVQPLETFEHEADVKDRVVSHGFELTPHTKTLPVCFLLAASLSESLPIFYYDGRIVAGDRTSGCRCIGCSGRED